MDYFLKIDMGVPLVSIITVCFNSEKTIQKTIQSLLNQSVTGFEYILVDGKSKDSTIEIIKSFENKFKEKGVSYKWISEKDTGIYNAFNKGINLSKGKWISFLGSDDIYLETAIEMYKTQINNISTKIDFIHSNLKVEKGKTFSSSWKWITFRRKMTIAHVGGFHNRNYFTQYGLFNEEYKIAGDYELLLRAKEKLKTLWLNENTVIMGNDGISNNQIKKVYLETTKAKIETAKINVMISKIDYFTWMFKHKIKTLLNAIT
jgi:glycosyltransferase involved in cell wall biosynthesis